MKALSSTSKFTIGSAFGETIGQVKTHADLPKSVKIFRDDRTTRIENIVKSDEQIKQVPFMIGRYFNPDYDGSEFADLQKSFYGDRTN